MDNGYIYRRTPNAGEDWVIIANPATPTTTTYTDTNVQVGQRYEYRVYRTYTDIQTFSRGYAIAGILGRCATRLLCGPRPDTDSDSDPDDLRISVN